MAKHNQTGKDGEVLALAWLTQNGYHVMHQNWRHGNWEVDFIASRNGRLHIIEVKTRTSSKFGYPEENMGPKKMQFLINAAEQYLYIDPQWQQLQFDILSITINATEVEYFLIEDVYL
jgi:putative endonuclease